MELTSRIHKFIPRELMIKLNKICKDRSISDNNMKADMISDLLKEFKVPFRELGPGTNRYSVRIDGYVFKIAMDKSGVNDNYIEFSMSPELQPYVAKTYECNGLIITAEYVTGISKEEFRSSEEPIKAILAILSGEYLLGDVGYVLKNYLNWGYREDGTLVILDYGFIYRVTGEEVRCDHVSKTDKICGTFLEYDENYSLLVCPKCGRKYNFADIRRKMNLEYEKREIEKSKDECYLMKSEHITVDDKTLKVVQSVFDDDNDATSENINERDDIIMNPEEPRHELTEEEAIEMYEDVVMHFDDRPKAKVIDPVSDCADEDEDPDTPDDTQEEEKDELDIPTFGSDYYNNSEGLFSEAEELTFTLATIFERVALFTPERLQDFNVPDGFFKYELREAEEDEGNVIAVGKKILIDFYGTILCTEIIPGLETETTLSVDSDDEFSLSRNDITIPDFWKLNERADFMNASVYDDDDDEDEEDDDLCRVQFNDDLDEEDNNSGECSVNLQSTIRLDTGDDEFMEDPEEKDIINQYDDDSDTASGEMPTEEDTVIPISDYDEDTNIDIEEELDVDADEDDEDPAEIIRENTVDIDTEAADESIEKVLNDQDESDDDEDYTEEPRIEEIVEEAVETVMDNIEDELTNELASRLNPPQNSSFTTWNEPREQLKDLVDAEEESERSKRSSKRYKHNKKYT